MAGAAADEDVGKVKKNASVYRRGLKRSRKATKWSHAGTGSGEDEAEAGGGRQSWHGLQDGRKKWLQGQYLFAARIDRQKS